MPATRLTFPAGWCWVAWPEREVFAHPAYWRLFAARESGRAFCATWDVGDVCILFPFILSSCATSPLKRGGGRS
jgi:hypothetical protein